MRYTRPYTQAAYDPLNPKPYHFEGKPCGPSERRRPGLEEDQALHWGRGHTLPVSLGLSDSWDPSAPSAVSVACKREAVSTKSHPGLQLLSTHTFGASRDQETWMRDEKRGLGCVAILYSCRAYLCSWVNNAVKLSDKASSTHIYIWLLCPCVYYIHIYVYMYIHI